MSKGVKKNKKSALQQRVEELFLLPPDSAPTVPPADFYPTYPEGPKVIQTYTTYSVCEEPIPNLYNRR
jgi:hypothetical protein